jgi:hypothetical protein
VAGEVSAAAVARLAFEDDLSKWRGRLVEVAAATFLGAEFSLPVFKKSRWSPINGNIGYIRNLSVIEIKFQKNLDKK